jgi:hypothetical protein
MKNPMIKQVTGLAAAACTTLLIFSAVASLADPDRAALAASQQATKMAALASAAVR